MLLRLSRVSFWFAAAVAALALVAPGGHETALTALAVLASLLAFGFWRSALTHRDPVVPVELAAPVGPSEAALRDAAALVAQRAREAASFDAALHAVAQVLRSELGAREVKVLEVVGLDATHASVSELIEAQPGFRTVKQRVRLDAGPLGAAVRGRCEAGHPPGPVALPAVCGDRVIAVIELTGLELPVAPRALGGLLELARLALSHRAACDPSVPPPSRSVEDKDAHSGATTRMLPPVGCRAAVASGMLEGLDTLGRRQCDLVPLEADEGRLGQLGVDDHLARPFRRSQMLAMLIKRLRPHAPAEPSDSAAPAGGPQAALDPGALARLGELDPTGENRLLERVLQAFQASVARLHPQLDAAKLGGDRAGIRLVVHTLKSSSASIGALRLSQLCAQIETLIRLETGDDLDGLLQALDTALADTLQAIAQRLETAR